MGFGTSRGIELGTGVSSFVDLPQTGGTLELVYGVQGGWHIEASVRIYELPIDDEALAKRGWIARLLDRIAWSLVRLI